MIVVINAGGSGTRLWPLSTPESPKQLLKLTDDTSLLQRTYERAKRISDRIYVIPEAGHADKVRRQLPELDESHIIVEPARRGTANCIINGLAHIARDGENGESIIFMHADHQIRDVDSLADVVHYAGKIAAREQKITLIGVEPTYPAAFGYIHKGEQLGKEGEEFVYKVRSFKEKPPLEIARQYQQSGEYLWNVGYFVAPLTVFLQKIEQNAPSLFANYQALQKAADEKSYRETYLGFDNLIIDYELMETTPDLLVVPGTFDWMDIGSFNDLPGVVELDGQGNHFRGAAIEAIEVENSYIRNEEQKPVAVIGLDNIVVVNTANGLLVARRDLAQKVGDIAKKLQS